MKVEQWNKNDQKVEYLSVEEWNIWWWNSGTSDVGTVEHNGGTVEQLMVEQWNIWWWNSGIDMVENYNVLSWNSLTSDGGTVEHLIVEQ